LPECARFLAVPHGDPIPWESLAEWNSPDETSVAIAGSHPVRMNELEEQLVQHGWRSAWRLTDRGDIPLAIDVDEPQKVGIDRLLNAVAANRLRPAGRATIVIDTGTAATVDFVSEDGRFCGGAILPGFALSAEALHSYTALLPRLTVRELANEPPLAVGRNTNDAIRSGVYWGHAGALKEIVAQICRERDLPLPGCRGEHGDSAAPWLLLTGGGAPFLEPVFPGIQQVPSLALHGLAIVAQGRDSTKR
jgi:type III pantothenate kinase